MNIKTSDFGTFLLITGAFLSILYIPNGMLHRFLGSGVYGRDILLGFHFMGILMYLLAIRQMRYFFRAAWPIAVVMALLILPLYNSRGNLRDLAILVKWGFAWTDWMAMGYLVALRGNMPKLSKVAIVLGLLVITTDASIGYHEERTNKFFFPAEDAETGAGVKSARNNQLEGAIRVQGLQRDVFSFANFMGVGFTVCLITIALKRRASVTILCAIPAIYFAYVGFNSGGRSVFFGMLLVLALFSVAFFSRTLFGRYASKIMLLAIIGQAAMAVIGIGQSLLFILNTLGLRSGVLNLASSFERDEVWRERIYTLADYPISLLLGMPSAFYVSRVGDPIDFVDNLPLWLLYHFGTVGCVCLGIYFVRYCRPSMHALQPDGYLVFIFFAGLVWGEGLARDTFTFYGALPMFGAAGFLAGKYAIQQRQIFLEKYQSERKESILTS